ncbi:type II secretion system protein GspD [Paraburkholderia tuberum]|uniref:type II secretion system protein GspD n=1 Tax=Paraburkholderia tuberum TaxID=157910 RepID=UPI0031BA9395
MPPLPTLPPLPASVPVGGVSVPAPVHLAALPKMRGSHVDLRFVPVAQVVDLIFAEMLDTPYVVSPDVLADDRPVSFRYDRADGDVRQFAAAFLQSLGYQVMERNGVSFVSKGKADGGRDEHVLVYVPRFRRADYLARLVQPLVGARVASNGPVAAAPGDKVASAVPAASAAARIDQSTDQLVLSGSADELERARKVLDELDTAAGEVVIRGWAYEVDDTDSQNSGFSLAVKAFGGSFGFGSGSASSSTDPNAFSLSASSLTLAISALEANSRFHEVSSPHVRVVSGQAVKLNVGQQVPTVSSVSYQGTSGTPVQSVEYQDAGVIFNVTPTVMRDTIELNVDEEISSFVNTTTGVNSSPTKNTRSLQTVADMKDGEVIVLGGLIQDQSTVARDGQRWLPSFLDGRSASKGRTEVVLILQVQKV